LVKISIWLNDIELSPHKGKEDLFLTSFFELEP
jgi:hypothetical protein